MKIYVLGSTKFMHSMVRARDDLKKLGLDGWIHENYDLLVQGKLDVLEEDKATHQENADRKKKYDYLRVHYAHILESDAILAKQTTPTTVNLPETTDIPVSEEDATNQQAIDGPNVSHETGTPQTPTPVITKNIPETRITSPTPKPSTALKQTPAVGTFFLVVVDLTLFGTQLTIYDAFSRIRTENTILASNGRISEKHIPKVYHLTLWLFIFAGIAVTLLGFTLCALKVLAFNTLIIDHALKSLRK